MSYFSMSYFNFSALSLITILSLFSPGSAFAAGFAVKDLRALRVAPEGFTGGDFKAVATSANRLTIFCAQGCSEPVAIDVMLGRQTDGTEGRLRSGETTVQHMEKICQSRDPSCILKGLKIGRAIGFFSVYNSPVAGSTTILFRDGDLLTIRSVANDSKTAAANGKRSKRLLAATISAWTDLAL